MAYPQESQQPYQTTDLRPGVPGAYEFQPPAVDQVRVNLASQTYPPNPQQGHDMGGVGHFPVPAATTTAPAQTQSAPIPTQSDPYAIQAWGAAYEDFTCPSGQRCALRKPDLPALLRAGLLDKLNVLAGTVDAQIWASQGMPPIDTQKLLQDPAKFTVLSDLLDAVLPLAVARPTILPAVDEEGELIPVEYRKPGVGYVDFVDFSDKVAIFEKYISGVSAMTSFRAGAQQPGERVADGSGPALSS